VDFNLDYCDSRAQLLERLNDWLATHDPDAIIGWNVVQFDLRTPRTCPAPQRAAHARRATNRWPGANTAAGHLLSPQRQDG
jgi:hypothetical protein